jgi:hypothetical protein
MTNVTGDTYGAAISMDNISTLSVQSVIDVNTPSAETFAQDNVNVTDNTFPTLLTVFPSGLKVRATSTGTLPAGITTGVDYFVIPVTANTIKLATSLANALAGTAIDITDTGTAAATGTLTPTSIAGATISYQKTNVTDSNTGTATTTAARWTDIDTATAVTVDATNWYDVIGPDWHWFRVKATLTAGSMTIINYIVGRGDDND